jgi:Histidine kinase-, DNA gyrase B-, and HSP90-like ATPase
LQFEACGCYAWFRFFLLTFTPIMFPVLSTCINDVKNYAQNKGNNHGEEKHRWISFSVSDTGCGMKPTELAEMYEPYTQGDGNQHKFVGTGLGLFICVSLCYDLGGFMACSSTFNQGTNFFVAVPVEIVLMDPGSDISEEDALTEDESTTRIPLFGPILIVDDNNVNVKVLHRQLENELKKVNIQAELISAYGGEVALQLYKARLPSVLIIDYHMPCMLDYELHS